jgi:hypothetical protein
VCSKDSGISFSMKDKCVEVVSTDILIKNTQDVLDLMGNYPADAYVFHTHNFEDDFFDLSTKKLGEILQKFSNYRIKVAIIGDFNKYPSKTLKDFIYETNKFGDYLFVPSMEEVEKKWQK